jgi:hypothetical protein
MAILAVEVAPVGPCIAGAGGRAGRAGTADELLGAHDVAVAWICGLRLERAAGWKVALADLDPLHRYSFCVVVAVPGAAPVRSGRRMSGYGW